MDWKPLKVYLILIGVGAALLASVWTVKGWVGDVVGGLGILLMLFGLFAMQGHFHQEDEKAAKETEHEDYLPLKLNSEDFGEHPPTQRKIRWISGIALAICGIGFYFCDRFPAPFEMLVLAEVIAIGFSSLVIFDASFDSKEKSRSIGWVWKTDEKFRKTVWAFIFGMMISLLPWAGGKATLVKSKEFLIYQAPFFLLFVGLLIGFAAFLDRKLKFDSRRISTWKLSEKALDVFFWITMFVGLVSMQAISRLFFAPLVSELKFALLFAAIGLGVGWMLLDFLKTHFTNLFSAQSHKRDELKLRVYLTGILATGFFAAYLNYQTAQNNAFYNNYLATEKSKSREEELSMFVEVGGKSKRFYPKRNEWQSISPPDSVKVLVGKGIFGFDVFLKFEPINH